MGLGYKDVKERLLQDILCGKYNPGDRLPTGKELCNSYSVSNMTVDRALREMVGEGLICRDRKQGTRVAEEGRSIGAIALLIPTLSTLSTFPQLADGVQQALGEERFQLVLAQTNMDMDLTFEAVKSVVRDKVKGVIYIPANNSGSFARNAEALNYLRTHGIPVVVAGHCDLPGLEWLSGVSSDHFGGANAITNHLIRRGYRKIGLFGCMTNDDHKKIVEGYRRAMEENGLEIDDSWEDLFNPSLSVSARVKKYRHVAGEIDAVFCIGDHIAAEAIKGLLEMGVRIPGDVAVAGFGDHPICRYLPVELITVHVQHKEEGEVLAHMLTDLIKGNLQQPTRIELPCSLVIRKSCGVGQSQPVPGER